MPELSVVIPAHNEEATVPELVGVLQELLADENFELLFVDDGSTDRTQDVLTQILSQNERVRAIQLSRNFGHQAALLAGLTAARGKAVITMDCDFQHPPELLPEMIRHWRNGKKIVQMVRKSTEGISPVKKFLSDKFYKYFNKFSDVPITEGAADFQLLDRVVVDEIVSMQHSGLFLRGLVSWLGFDKATINYTAADRKAGQASYSFRQSLQLATTAILSMSRLPLRLGLISAVGASVISLFYGIYVLSIWMTDDIVEGWTSLVLVVLFLGSLQLLVTGIIGEYVGRIYNTQRRLPPFVQYKEERHTTISPEQKADV